MTTKSNQKYWSERYIQLKAAAEKSEIQFENDMHAQLNAINESLNTSLQDWYKRYASSAHVDSELAAKILRNVHHENWEMELDEFIAKAKQGGYEDELDVVYIKSRVARLKQLQSQLSDQMAIVTPSVQTAMGSALTNNYEDTYLHTKHLDNQITGVTGSFSGYDQVAVNTAVSKPWLGKNFSQRIWGDFTEDLPEILVRSLSEAMVMGYSSRKVSKQLYEKYAKFEQHNWHALVQTEMAHIAEQATYSAYVDDGLEKYQYMATLETRTCDTCRKLDMEIFKVSEKKDGANYPPIHTHCRCTTVPYIKDFPPIDKRWSQDPETGKGRIVKGQTYDEWYNSISVNQKLYNNAREMKPQSTSYKWNQLNADQYNKHVSGTSSFKNYEAGRKHPVSELTISPEQAQSLIDQYGHKKMTSNARHQVGFTNETAIGYWVDIDGAKYATRNGRISYRNGKGAHITPMKPTELKG